MIIITHSIMISIDAVNVRSTSLVDLDLTLGSNLASITRSSLDSTFSVQIQTF